MFEVTKQFNFSAAHFLTNYHGRCENMHGHNYVVAVTVRGPLQPDGMVIDFVELKQLVDSKIIRELDHTNLNDRFTNPTCEVVAQWIFDQLKPTVPITTVRLWETDTSFVTYNEA
ncbi:MAG: 6-carboxytetrahydropterin synthase QueD [Candidatus Kerfeldbacteria bacterium]|nr:6-carboxytetrahydropterin synthase QueD [Candidatus Kerfeldbacteria bacterium]